MSDQEIIKGLAEREGWAQSGGWWVRSVAVKDGWKTSSSVRNPPDYLGDLNACQRVLGLLTEAEKDRLDDVLRRVWVGGDFEATRAGVRWWLLTLPARELARAIAEVLE